MVVLMSSILIVGANGFIGLKLLQTLTSFKNIYTISRNKLNKVDKSNIHEYRFDIGKTWSFKDHTDIILFCATHHQFSKDKNTPIDYVNTNITGLINSLEFAKKNKPKCFIYFSTMAIYGKPREKNLQEDSSIFNPDIYGTSKYFAEKILQHYSSFFKILIIRLPGVVDKVMPENRPWISTVIYKLKNNLDIKIYNPTSNFNNIIDIDNITQLIESAIASKINFQYEIVNMAASKPMKLIDVIYLLKLNLKSNSKIICDNLTQKSFEINIKKLDKLFNFIPETTGEILDKISKID